MQMALPVAVDDEEFDIVYGSNTSSSGTRKKPLSTKTAAGLVASTFKFDCSDISKTHFGLS